MRKTNRAAAALLAGLILAGCAGKNSSDDVRTAEQDDNGDHTGYVDTLTPGIDYYGYINGKELLDLKLDSKHQSIGTLNEVADLVDEQINDMLDEIAASNEEFPRGSCEQIVHDLYHLIEDDYENKLGNDAEDTAIIDGILERINSVENVDGLKLLWHDLSLDYGLDPFITCGISINFYNTDENVFVLDYTAPVDLEDIKDSQVYASSNRDILADKLKNAGVPADDATKRATEMIYVLYGIAGHTDVEILNGEKKIEDYFNVFPSSELSDIFHNLSLHDILYCSGYSGKTPDSVVIYDPEQITAIDSYVDEEHVQVWKDLAICNVIDTYSLWLPDKYNFTNGEKVSGERMARYIIKTQLEQVVGELYAARYYTEEKRQVITKICEDMKSEYYVLIDGADWLSAEGRALLKEKLDKMEFYIGADEPHEIDPADADVIKGSVLQTLISVSSSGVKQKFEEFDKPPSHNGFDLMAASTINACYSRHYNCINITAGVTNYPMYDENADYYTNMGRIGTVIGHEISHAFDSGGVKYDADGNLRPDAMPEADIKAFEEKQQKVIEYYDSFTVLGSHVKGKLTLAENFADISGVQCALAIAETPENQKTVFENYARVWMSLEQDTLAKSKLDNDVHAPSVVRINAVVACFDEFYDIYGVKEGDPMYVAPEERVRRW